MGDRTAPAASAVGRHPHLAARCPPGWVRVDMHVHTMWSGDSSTTPTELAEAVEETAIDVLCITDHHAVAGAEQLRDELSCRVVVGEEVRTSAGELIGLFLTERVPQRLSPEATAHRIRVQGGLVYVPHPFDPMRHCITSDALERLCDQGLVDVVEVLNAKTSLPSLNAQAATFAAARGVGAGAGSDAHVPGAIGASYVEIPDFDGPTAFLAGLAAGRVVGAHWDEPRPWAARVVPSVAGH